MGFEPIRGLFCLTPSERVFWRAKLAAMTIEERREWRDWWRQEHQKSKPMREAMRRAGEKIGRRIDEKIFALLASGT